jgi:hypothetical protein
MYSVQTLLLAVLLPWTAIRCMASGDLPGLAMLAALTGARSSAAVAAKALAVSAALAATVLSGMPFAVLAEQISARPALQIVPQLATSLALAAFVGALSTAAVVMRLQRLSAWLLTTVVSVAVASAITWS